MSHEIEIKNLSKFVGKTIKSINESAVNCKTITFTDGSEVQIFADCGSSHISIPYFVLYENEQRDSKN